MHIPVLLDAVLEKLGCQGGTYVDGTFGAGGYTCAILEKNPKNKVIAFDRDPHTYEKAEELKKIYKDRFCFIPDRFSQVSKYVDKVDGFVLDVGVSSMQIDQPERGFSFRFDGPLDMRMSGEGISAADVINTSDEKTIADILYNYGEEKQSYRIAREIISKRPIYTTKQLVDIVHSVMPRPKDNSDSAMRTFQALRIYVNQELEELKNALESSKKILNKGGRLVVVSFHSLEDRIVKEFLVENSNSKVHKNKYKKDIDFQEKKDFEILEKNIVVSSEEELRKNSRAHSAKLRWAVKI